MMQSCTRTGKPHAYKSCIKINGLPILPPLITPEKRIELQTYKQKAIELERHLKCHKQLESVLNDCSFSNLNTQQQQTRTLEHQLSFDCSDSHVDALNLSSNNKESNLPSTVPLSRTNQKPSTLTCNIFDVSQYSDDGVVIFHDCSSKSKDNMETFTRKVLNKSLPLAKTCSLPQTPLHKLNEPELGGQSKPRLESPSPILLEHFKKQAELEPNTYLVFEKYLKQKSRSLDLKYSDSCEQRVQDNDGRNQSKFVPLDTDVIKDINLDGSRESYRLISEENKEIFETLAHKYFGTSNSEPSLQNDGDSVDILQLLDKYKNEEAAVELNSSHNKDTNENSNDYFLFDPLFENTAERKTPAWDEDTKLSCCNSTSLNFSLTSPTDTLNALNTSTPLLIDFDSEIADNEVLLNLNNDDADDDLNSKLSLIDNGCLYLSDGRGVPAETSGKEKRKLKERWAATVLTAAAKGYLVRRLKNTERVRNLIQTIRDALLCAVSLHKENTENIQPSDVELHRRLIQQVSAACYEFYNIFFYSTIKEQMAMIALDRQRLQEKLRRPKSGSNIKLDSGKSTPKSQRRQSFNVRQKKNLTPTFAA